MEKNKRKPIPVKRMTLLPKSILDCLKVKEDDVILAELDINNETVILKKLKGV